MLSLEIRLLTGRYAAATVRDAGKAEWPPHPARVYSALTAALHDEPNPPADEILALEWLAECGAPDIIASSATERALGNVYVPTNDQKTLADIDKHIDRVVAAELALGRTDAGKGRAKAEKGLEKAESALLARSVASSAADGKGTPSNAAELENRRLNPKARRFPVAIPDNDVVHLRWAVSPNPEIVGPLDRVAARVARLGHSSSLVTIRVVTGPVDIGTRECWVPDEQGHRFLRVPDSGQLERLEREHQRHQQIDQRVLPANSVRYIQVSERRDAPDVPATVFSSADHDWIIFEVVGPSDNGRHPRFDISLAQHVARALRGALLGHVDPATSPEELTGHSANGQPATRPHLAYVPLANVGNPYASGAILGIALIPPREFSVHARDLLLESVHRAETMAARSAATGEPYGHEPHPLRLTLGRRGVVHVQRLRDQSLRKTLAPSRWTRPSIRWYSATAVALGRNPGNLQSRDADIVARAVEAAERTIAADCIEVGLPEPAAVWVHARSLLNGAPAARRFMPFPAQGNGLRRVCVHAELLFHEPVRGPLILGSGRYFGLGLCAPVSDNR